MSEAAAPLTDAPDTIAKATVGFIAKHHPVHPHKARCAWIIADTPGGLFRTDFIAIEIRAQDQHSLATYASWFVRGHAEDLGHEGWHIVWRVEPEVTWSQMRRPALYMRFALIPPDATNVRDGDKE